MRKFLDSIAHKFEKGGPLEKFYPLYEGADTILYSPGMRTRTAAHVRDGIDLKRMMLTVIFALLPCVAFAAFNTGYQANFAISNGAAPLDNWQEAVFAMLGLAHDPASLLSNVMLGLIYFVPIFAVTGLIGGHVEVAFAILRKHEINEGFLVTLFLFPLSLPPTVPLWQVALGITFGIVFGKEVFGGTGMNFLNPALTARAFLFFAYPAQMSGNVWIAAGDGPDGATGATWLGHAAADANALQNVPWMDAFLGTIPGSMGETSALACFIGAGILIVTGVGSWRTMLGVFAGSFLLATLMNMVQSDTNPMFQMPFHWHMVLGGWAFGTVYMATDPVSSAFTNTGKLWYGFGIGALVILVRVVNPAYPEGMMLAILFMNMFAPLIDHFVVQANIKRRLARQEALA